VPVAAGFGRSSERSRPEPAGSGGVDSGDAGGARAGRGKGGGPREPGARAGRRDYSHLPRVEIIWDLEGGYCCPQCGEPFTLLGSDHVGEQLDWLVIVRVRADCRRRYRRACSCRVPATVTAPGPPKAIGKGLVSNAFIAMLLTERHAAGRSQNSLVTGLAQQGADISPATLTGMCAAAGALLAPLACRRRASCQSPRRGDDPRRRNRGDDRGRVPWTDPHWLARAGSVRLVLWAGGQVLLSGARRQAMFERFTDRARRVVVLAQQEARRLDHNCIGTEHILLGLIHEGEGVAAKALESLGISLDAVRQEVEEIIERGQEAPSGHIPFTPRAKKVLELTQREALHLGHNYIGTEHILLGLIREGDGVAAQVLVKLGADLNRVRQQVIQLLHGHQAKEPVSAGSAAPELRLLPAVQARLEAVEQRLTAIEQRVGTGPDTSDLDGQINRVRRERHDAADVQEYEQAASLRDREKELLASKVARHEQWTAGHPALPDLAQRVRQLSDEVERLRALLRQHGIDRQDKPA
jgi:transposase